mmetsp:Transcript_36085/g.77799  ORF Transcript_36085/g.77799 Transcript_36085/m.77799 type:complete len:419 (+) Transcript_36085:96-1352(+)
MIKTTKFALTILATAGVCAKASDRRHSLLQKGNELHRRNVLTNDQKGRLQSRVLKNRGKREPKVETEKDEAAPTTTTESAAEEVTATVNVNAIAAAAKVKVEEELKNAHLHLGAAKPSETTTRTARAGTTTRESKAGDSKHSPAKAPSNAPPSRAKSGKNFPMPSSSRGKSRKDDSKSGKSEEDGPPSTICSKRLSIAFDQITSLDPDDDGPFGLVTEPSDVTDLCYFMPPDEQNQDFNFGCPFLFIPGLGFVQGEEEYVEIFGEEAGVAFQSFVMYCQCYQGLELGCAAKIPHGPPAPSESVNGYSEFIPFSTPDDRAEYCKMAGVWNGDFDSDDVELTPDVEECGCFFVGQAQDMVDQCPGVELGEFFEFPEPSDPTMLPTGSPTYFPTIATDMPTQFPTLVLTGEPTISALPTES